MAARGLSTLRTGLHHASYFLKKAAVNSSETVVITYETRNFASSKEHNTDYLLLKRTNTKPAKF
jgi:hypothetical protein